MNEEVHVRQTWDYKAELWAFAGNDQQFRSSVDVAQVWNLHGGTAAMEEFRPVSIKADDDVVHSRNDPTAEPSAPFLAFDFQTPDWMQTLVGFPAYMSFSLYLHSDNPDVVFHKGDKMQPLFEVDVSGILEAAFVSQVVQRRLNDNLMYLRLVTWGMVKRAVGAKVRVPKCVVHLDTNRIWTNHSLSYHVVVACGVDGINMLPTPEQPMQTVTKESPVRKKRFAFLKKLFSSNKSKG